MEIRQVIGILVILGAYGLTWYLLLKSLRIVKIIDREGLDHAGDIRARLKMKSFAASDETESGGTDGGNRPGEGGGSDGRKQ